MIYNFSLQSLASHPIHYRISWETRGPMVRNSVLSAGSQSLDAINRQNAYNPNQGMMGGYFPSLNHATSASHFSLLWLLLAPSVGVLVS